MGDVNPIILVSVANIVEKMLTSHTGILHDFVYSVKIHLYSEYVLLPSLTPVRNSSFSKQCVYKARVIIRDSRAKHGNHGNHDFRQVP